MNRLTLLELMKEGKFTNKEIAESKWADICQIFALRKVIGSTFQSIFFKIKEGTSLRYIAVGDSTCAFCNTYPVDDCTHNGEICPVYEETGMPNCGATPFSMFISAIRNKNSDEAKKYAGEMLELIRSLEGE